MPIDANLVVETWKLAVIALGCSSNVILLDYLLIGFPGTSDQIVDYLVPVLVPFMLLISQCN